MVVKICFSLLHPTNSCCGHSRNHDLDDILFAGDRWVPVNHRKVVA